LLNFEKCRENYFNFINDEIDFIAESLGISKLHIYSHLPHLKSQEAFKEVLLQHQKESSELFQASSSSGFVDHTKLSPEATSADIKKLCDEAKKHSFAAVCVNGGRVEQAVQELKGTNIAVAAVVGFPLGATSSKAKLEETKDLVSKGATEIDYVIDIGRIKDKDYKYILASIYEIVSFGKTRNVKVKVILETCLLTQQEIVHASILCVLGGAHYVKTSTGMGKPIPPKSVSGAVAEDVKLMKLTVGRNTKVKASGGISDPETFSKMVNNGAFRIGTSNGVKLGLTSEQARELFPNDRNENNY